MGRGGGDRARRARACAEGRRPVLRAVLRMGPRRAGAGASGLTGRRGRGRPACRRARTCPRRRSGSLALPLDLGVDPRAGGGGRRGRGAPRRAPQSPSPESLRPDARLLDDAHLARAREGRPKRRARVTGRAAGVALPRGGSPDRLGPVRGRRGEASCRRDSTARGRGARARCARAARRGRRRRRRSSPRSSTRAADRAGATARVRELDSEALGVSCRSGGR